MVQRRFPSLRHRPTLSPSPTEAKVPSPLRDTRPIRCLPAPLSFLTLCSTVNHGVCAPQRGCPCPLPAAARRFATAGAAFSEPLRGPVGRPRFARPESRRLYELLVAPLESDIQGSTALSIETDGTLDRIPFDLLRGPDSRIWRIASKLPIRRAWPTHPIRDFSHIICQPGTYRCRVPDAGFVRCRPSRKLCKRAPMSPPTSMTLAF